MTCTCAYYHSEDEKKYQEIYQKASENIKSFKLKSRIPIPPKLKCALRDYMDT